MSRRDPGTEYQELIGVKLWNADYPPGTEVFLYDAEGRRVGRSVTRGPARLVDKVGRIDLEGRPGVLLRLVEPVRISGFKGDAGDLADRMPERCA
ncbi:MAG: hypothetical protein AB7E47_05975 [Desulfovibrionaceae bacterium]